MTGVAMMSAERGVLCGIWSARVTDRLHSDQTETIQYPGINMEVVLLLFFTHISTRIEPRLPDARVTNNILLLQNRLYRAA